MTVQVNRTRRRVYKNRSGLVAFDFSLTFTLKNNEKIAPVRSAGGPLTLLCLKKSCKFYIFAIFKNLQILREISRVANGITAVDQRT